MRACRPQIVDVRLMNAGRVGVWDPCRALVQASKVGAAMVVRRGRLERASASVKLYDRRFW